jgi:hypothetical protein
MGEISKKLAGQLIENKMNLKRLSTLFNIKDVNRRDTYTLLFIKSGAILELRFWLVWVLNVDFLQITLLLIPKNILSADVAWSVSIVQ